MLGTLEQNQAVLVIFNVVGICSMCCYFWFTILTRETFPELCLDAFMAATFLLLAAGVAVNHFFGLLALGASLGRHQVRLGHAKARAGMAGGNRLRLLLDRWARCSTFTCRWRA